MLTPLQAALDEIDLDACGAARNTLTSVTDLAIEIAREGREGRRIGTIFTVGAEDEVLRRSRCLILDPLAMHPPERRRISDPDLRETIKELAQLDGGFIVSGDGVALSACRYFESTLTSHQQPLGLGTRHIAAASISKQADTVAVVVSESSVVRLYAAGTLITEILPELCTKIPVAIDRSSSLDGLGPTVGTSPLSRIAGCPSCVVRVPW